MEYTREGNERSRVRGKTARLSIVRDGEKLHMEIDG